MRIKLELTEKETAITKAVTLGIISKHCSAKDILKLMSKTSELSNYKDTGVNMITTLSVKDNTVFEMKIAEKAACGLISIFGKITDACVGIVKLLPGLTEELEQATITEHNITVEGRTAKYISERPEDQFVEALFDDERIERFYIPQGTDPEFLGNAQYDFADSPSEAYDFWFNFVYDEKRRLEEKAEENENSESEEVKNN